MTDRYKLYVNKEKFELKIKKMTINDVLNSDFDSYCKSDKVTYFNSSLFFCKNRAKLKRYAVELKEQWLEENSRERFKIMEINYK